MARKWTAIPIQAKWFANIPESGLTRAQAAIENGFINEADGYSRFPGLEDFATLPGDNGRVYLHDWRGNLLASTSLGNTYRIDKSGNVTNVTGVPISGGGRTIYAKTDTDLLMAAGGPIIALNDAETRILSKDAPDSTHVGFVDSYVVAIENYSGRFYHAAAGVYDSWDPLDVFAADGKPDNLTSLIVTEFRELILSGPDSMEQFERLSSGTTPFFRRWANGRGVAHPYTVLSTDNGVWVVNEELEFSRVSGQTSQPRGEDVGRTMEAIDDWTDVWIGGYPNKPLNILGQKFILLQAPCATTPYGTRGRTLIHDYRQNRWYDIYGWNDDEGAPGRWPGWSYWPMLAWGKREHYVGGEGKIYRLNLDGFTNAGGVQRFYVRTAPLSNMGEIRIDNLRARFQRGTGSYVTAPVIRIRALRDDRKYTNWVRKSFGKAGERDPYIEFGGMGCGHTWQFEIAITDDTPIELVSLDAQITPLGE